MERPSGTPLNDGGRVVGTTKLVWRTFASPYRVPIGDGYDLLVVARGPSPRRELEKRHSRIPWSPRQAREPARTRTCSECHLERSVTEFVAIKRTGRYYGRCKTCRAAKARARCHANPTVRTADINRAQRNRQKHREALAATVVGESA
jgi:hypothetical protein